MNDTASEALNELDQRLATLEAADESAKSRNRILDLILEVTQVQSDTMLSIVLERLGERETSKDALKKAADGLKQVISALRAEHEVMSGHLQHRKTELEAIKAALDEQH